VCLGVFKCIYTSWSRERESFYGEKKEILTYLFDAQKMKKKKDFIEIFSKYASFLSVRVRA